MRHLIYTLIVIVCFSVKAVAQTPIANLTDVEIFSGGGLSIGGGAFSQNGFMAIDQADNLFIAGTYTNYNGQYMRPIVYHGDTLYSDNAKGDIVLFKIDKSGTLVWNRRITSTALISITAIVTDHENNETIVFRNTELSFFEGLEFTPGQYILQIDQDGHYKWHTEISGMSIVSLTRDCADHVILAGYTTSHSTGIPIDTLIFGSDTIINFQFAPDSIKVGNQAFPPAGEYNLALLKFDRTGVFLWQKQFPGSFNHVLVSATYSDEIAVAGMLREDSVYLDNILLTSQSSVNHNTLFCMKTDPSGSVLWAQPYFTGSFSWDLQMAPDGAVYLGMEYYLSTSYGNIQIQSNGIQDILLYRLSTGGLFEWAKTVGGRTTNSRSVLSVNKKGDVTVSGFTFNVGEQVRKFDKLGNDIWSIPHSSGSGNQGAGECVFDSHGDMWHIGWFNGDFILGSFNYSIWGGTTYVHLSKYSAQDTVGIVPGCDVVSGLDPQIKSSQIQVYPNPAIDWIKFETDSKIKDICIFNALGHLVRCHPGTSAFVSLEGLAAGVYFAVLKMDTGASLIGKFIVSP